MPGSGGKTSCLFCFFALLLGLQFYSFKISVRLLQYQHLQNNVKEMDNYLTVNYEFRLGNNMFQYAALYGIAAKTNRTAYRPLSIRLGLNQFKPSAWMLPVRHNHENNLSVVIDSRFGTYDKTLHTRINTTVGPVRIGRLLQSWKYFKHVESQLRQTFIFRKSIMERALNQLRYMGHVHEKRLEDVSRYNTTFNHTIQSTNSRDDLIYIGVHVRRGDYITIPTCQMASVSFLVKAISHYRHAYQNVLFVISSNEIDWCKRYFGKEKDVQFVMNLDAPSTMALLSQCNHSIMTVGTFGWWSAWLAGGDVIYYTNFAKPNTGNTVTPEDYFWPQWIPIGD